MGPPVPCLGRFPCCPVGEGLAPPAGLRNGLVRRTPDPAPSATAGRNRERNSPHRAKPSAAARRVVAPYGRHGPRRAGGSGAPPLQRLRRNTAKPEGGRPHRAAPAQGNTPRCRPGRGGAALSSHRDAGTVTHPTQKSLFPVTIRSETAFYQQSAQRTKTERLTIKCQPTK